MRIIPITGSKAVNSAISPGQRYHVRLSRSRSRPPVLSVYDRVNRRRLFVWTGAMVDKMLDSGAFQEFKGNWWLTDKAFVCHLALLASAHQSEQIAPITPCGFIVSLLSGQHSVHLSEEEIVWLASMEFPCLPGKTVRQELNELVRGGHLQRIRVNDNLVFYDANTEPHLHIFDERTRELRDAPGNGVVMTRSRSASQAQPAYQ